MKESSSSRTGAANRNLRSGGPGAIFALALALALAPPSAHAEPATNRILSSQQIITQNGCTLMKVSYNIRVRYVSHFPQEWGEELRITVRTIDPAQAAGELLTRRESLRVPDPKIAPVKAIESEALRADGLVLTVQFLRPMIFKVGPGADFESIVIAMSDPKSGKRCKPELPIGAADTWSTTIVERPEVRRRVGDTTQAMALPPLLPARTPERAAGKISEADLRSAGAAMDEARAALKKSDYPLALKLLTKVFRYPESQYSADAQELLGVVYQKNKQPAEARAAYEDYLNRYPKGEGAESVRQRLAALEATQAPREERLRAAKQADGGGATRGPGESSWVLSGSASQFYVRDDSYRVVRDPSLPPLLNSDKEDHRVHRNALLSSLDLFAAWGNDAIKSKFRLSATEEHRFGDDGKEIVGVSALFLETAIRDWGTTTRIGRQTRNTGGVLGRFDGGLVSWQASPWMKLNVVGGSPVASRIDEPFKDDKYFLGTSVDFGSFFGGVDVSFFFIQQQARDVVDRQAVGTELRYVDAMRSAFLTVDYDTHFQELNAAIFSGAWTFADKSSIHGGVDYRKAPYLTSWNAIQGQQVLTLYDLLKLRTKSEIAQMAVDRTASYASASFGYSMPLTDKLQLNLDATAAHIDGTIASYGVDAMPSTGNEFYYSAQLLASSVLRDGDLFTAGARFADRQDSNTYVLDFGTRFPLTESWRINPRMFLSYREGKTTDLKEYAVMPSVLIDHLVGKSLSFEVEVGAKRTWHEQDAVKGQDTEFFITAGYRYDFHADGRSRCQVPSASSDCR